MKLKYYLRGLGIGIAITAIIMSFTAKPEELTDAQIKLRAAQLGMVEENTLADLQEESTDEINPGAASTENISNEDTVEEDVLAEEMSSEIPEEATTEESASNESGTTDSEIQEAEEDTLTASEEVSTSNEAEEQTGNIEETGSNGNIEIEDVENYIIITVEQGNGSDVVSRKLYEAGLINSIVEYDDYLISHGYDRRLRTGNHEIPADANKEEIAKILCGIN